MIQWGPADYSMSAGKQRGDAELLAVEKKVFTSSINASIPVRAEIETADQAKRYLDMGVKHFSIGIDLRILHSFCKSEGEKILKAMEACLAANEDLLRTTADVKTTVRKVLDVPLNEKKTAVL